MKLKDKYKASGRQTKNQNSGLPYFKWSKKLENSEKGKGLSK